MVLNVRDKISVCKKYYLHQNYNNNKFLLYIGLSNNWPSNCIFTNHKNLPVSRTGHHQSIKKDKTNLVEEKIK